MSRRCIALWRDLAEYGIEVLTGEACRIGARYLCDLDERGARIVRSLMGLLGDGTLADRHAMEKLPQTLVNVRVRDRGALEAATEVHAAVERESAALEGRGRVLLRPSGTEPLVRVMVEAPTAEEAEGVCARLVALVEAQLG